MSMPDFGAIEENNGLADDCYKSMNCKWFPKGEKISALFCTGSFTGNAQEVTADVLWKVIS